MPKLPIAKDEIGYNNLFNGMILTRDGGEIYSTTTVTATRIDQNVLWNNAVCPVDVGGTIVGNSVAASIAIQPGDMTVAAGQPATFTVMGAGSPPLSYQWLRNGVNISGAISASYTTPATTSADNGALFTVRVSNSVGSITSDVATLIVH